MNASGDSPTNFPDDRRGAAERALLAALCQGALPARARETVLQRLAGHKFSVPERDVIFQAVSRLPAGTTDHSRDGLQETARQLLMATLTRLGFPDVDLAPFFQMAAPAETELPSLLSDL